MSNILKDAAETTVHTLSDLAHEVRDRIEELPRPSASSRRTWIWWAVPVIAAGVVLKVLMSKRHRRSTIDAVADRVRKDVDIDGVAEHYQASVALGANAKGEGEITPLQPV